MKVEGVLRLALNMGTLLANVESHPVAGDLNLLVKIYHRIFLLESDTYHLVII